MIILSLFAFLAGVVTILSPCILPILPIILSSTIGGKETGKARPVGIVIGFIASFTFFTLFLSALVKLTGISPQVLRSISVYIIALFGISLLVPQIQILSEIVFSKLTRFFPRGNTQTGLIPGLFLGISIGLLWTPCVGPILASVISLAITGEVSLDAFFITLAYSLGTAIPMFLILVGGQNVFKRMPWLLKNTAKIQRGFGLLMIVTAIGIYFQVDRTIQTYILNTFPKYGSGLTQIEDNELVKKELQKVKENNNPSQTAPQIVVGGEWINSKPLDLKELKGKVVLIDFWTYTCINCQRTLPYIKDWWAKYKDSGLVIIGVHSPEFEFEKDKRNVEKAISDFGLTYPIVQDNEFSTWKQFNNQYWPAKYIIDKNGVIRYTHFGEGAYDETEKIIQELLKETGAKNLPSPSLTSRDQNYARTPEIYLGYGRASHFSSPETVAREEASTYSYPSQIPSNTFALLGNWSIKEEYITPQKGSELSLSFEAKQIFLVMNKTPLKQARVKVYIDDKLQFFGSDNKNGEVTIDSNRLYHLITLPKPGRHILRLEFEDENAQLFAFTFG